MKDNLRRRMRSTLRNVSVEERRELSRRACRLMMDQPEWSRARTVFVYVASQTELDTTALVETAWAERRRVLVPRVIDAEAGVMVPVEIAKWTDCVVGYRNLLEPVDDRPFPLDDIDLVIVPGLAFDAQGYRLGQGGGFYDRFLADSKIRGTACGFCYESQFLSQVPREEHDQALDLCVTPERVRRFRRRG